MEHIQTVRTDKILGIISNPEYLEVYNKDLIPDKANVTLIAIHDTDKNPHPDFKVEGFHDVLQMNFWDTERDSDPKHPPITKEQGKEIKDFILKNKDTKFLIHCAAGMSRSAGVGMALECLLNCNGSPYEFSLSPSDVSAHPRYSPNLTVYDAIVKDDYEVPRL